MTNFLTALFTRRIYKATPGINCRRDAAMRAGLFDETVKRRQDFDFLIRLSRVARCASTDRILWVKTNSDDSISGNDSTFLDAILDFAERHPAYLDDRRFRPGFAIDLARYFNRLVTRRRFALVAPGVARLSSLLGPARFAALLGRGYLELIRRRARP